MSKRKEKIIESWRRIKTSAQFRNVWTFLVFVAVAAVFWFVIAINDNVTRTFRVKLVLRNVPDSVTFINDPPAEIHVTVRDKGSNILRSSVIKNPQLELNFRDYANDGIFRVSRNDLSGELKDDLGGSVQISATSLDSLRLYYTDQPGRRVPVVVQSDVTAASGFIIAGNPVSLTRSVRVYSYGNEMDTVQLVRTQNLVRKGLSQTSEFNVKLLPIPHVKIVPSTVRVQVPVEPLVKKEAYVPVEVENQPAGASLLLFPNKVPVTFYVPMSRFNDESFPMRVVADFEETKITKGSKISVRVAAHGPNLINVELKTDSVDYTLVRH